MLQYKYDFQPQDITMVLVTSNLGAVLGGITMGHCSQILGRRFCIVVLCLIGGALMYPYTFTSGPGIYAAAFFEQFCVQGAFGIIPIHLLELSPVAFRTFVVGTSYQLGVLIASASNTIETHLGERYPLPSKLEDGRTIHVYDYSLVMCILMACTFTYVILATIIGPEDRKKPMTIMEDGDGDRIHGGVRRRRPLTIQEDGDGDRNIELRYKNTVPVTGVRYPERNWRGH
jgi:SHS family lactate transporter-like MFS transporter